MGIDEILGRIERETGVADLAALLEERLEPADLHSLLLEVYRRRVDRRSPAAVLSGFESNRFARPATTAPEDLLPGRSLELADGGAVDWTQKLLSNAKERLVISGISDERLCSLFRD